MTGRPTSLLLWALCAGLLSPVGSAAQEPATAILTGQVLKDTVAVDSGTVSLHQVGPDSAGEVASTRVSDEGRFRFVLPSVPDPSQGHAVYFASMRYRGVLYFGPAIAEMAQLDSLYVIQVYDTVSAPTGGQRFPLAVRNVFLESSGDGWQVTDLFQVRNDGNRTYVATDGPVWVYPLPPGATNFTVGQSDLAPDAVRFEGHILEASAPVPPGERLYMVRYTLPTLQVSIPTPGVTERMELLVREPAPPLSVDPLQAVQAVEVEEGTSYRRYTGQGLAGGSVVVQVTDKPSGIPFRWMAVVMALLLAMTGVVALTRGRKTPSPVGPAPGPNASQARREILLEIARLDEAFSQKEDPEPAQREAYRRLREELKDKLRTLDRGR